MRFKNEKIGIPTNSEIKPVTIGGQTACTFLGYQVWSRKNNTERLNNYVFTCFFPQTEYLLANVKPGMTIIISGYDKQKTSGDKTYTNYIVTDIKLA